MQIRISTVSEPYLGGVDFEVLLSRVAVHLHEELADGKPVGDQQ